ncbi:MAG: hypothetical protein AB1679_36535, partial [Actinomycetota bacterium]
MAPHFAPGAPAASDDLVELVQAVAETGGPWLGRVAVACLALAGHATEELAAAVDGRNEDADEAWTPLLALYVTAVARTADAPGDAMRAFETA